MKKILVIGINQIAFAETCRRLNEVGSVTCEQAAHAGQTLSDALKEHQKTTLQSIHDFQNEFTKYTINIAERSHVNPAYRNHKKRKQ